MVNGRLIALLSAALLVVGLLAGPGLATYTNTDTTDSDGSSSEAEISVVDCVVESTKDISYVAFLDSGEELDKFNVNAPTYDLISYGDIDSVDSVRVKSGQTVESFGVDCGDTTQPDEEPTDKPDEDDDDTNTDDDDTTGDDDDDTTGDDDETQPDEVKSHNDKANTNSQSTITLSGCTVNSSKDISYIAFLSDGEQVDKIEGVDSRSYNLDGYSGIDDIDAIRVKAGTTVASFGVDCGTATNDDEPVNDDDTKDEDTKSDDHDDDAKDDDATWDEHDDDVKEEDSDDDVKDDDSDEDSDDDAETDEEWDARHDGRHEHKDHQEIEHEDS